MRQYDSYRASQPAYVHGSAAPDLRRQGNPDVNVMPGRRNGVNHAGVPESIFGVAGVVFAVAIVIAIFACARVLLSAASVTTTIATDELSTQIARSATILRCSRASFPTPHTFAPRLRASEWRRLPLPKVSSLAPTSLQPTLRATSRFPEACLLWQAKARCASCLATRAVRRPNIPSAQIALGCSWFFLESSFCCS